MYYACPVKIGGCQARIDLFLIPVLPFIVGQHESSLAVLTALISGNDHMVLARARRNWTNKNRELRGFTFRLGFQ